MKQIIQDLKTGKTYLENLPVPKPGKGQVLIRTTRSLVSLGTEKMLVEFGKSSFINKARQQPEKVKQVLNKIKSDGLLPTIETVFKRLEEPLPLGYCNVGTVEAIGNDVSELKVGDRVTSNGKHAEYVVVNKNLVAKIPDEVSDEQAVFTVIGSIGLQGIRLCAPTFGETIVVTGLGLIGLLTAQMLLTNGCNVIGIDIDEEKCQLAERFGITTIAPSKSTNPVKSVLGLTNSIGADGVIITASAKNNEIISQAARMSRKRGRIVLVGVVGLNISRADFYEKELTFQVSCSYGPGRYDDNYEQKGVDYPLPFVRWTEKRNFEAVLRALEKGQLLVKPLITDRVPLDAYDQIYGNMSKKGAIASVLVYPERSKEKINRSIQVGNKHVIHANQGTLGIIGAGNFTKMTLLPLLKKINADIKYIASSKGLSSTVLAKKYGIPQSTTDYRVMLDDKDIDAVIITTRHHTHAELAVEALNSGKHVFVEKPLAINEDQLNKILAYKGDCSVTVGFNRRFSPHIQAVKAAIGNQGVPINIVATMNAGFIPANVWVQDLKVGGGRIIGEACHYLDLCAFLANSPITSVCMNALGENPELNTDNASILLHFANGSNAVINYFSNGSKAYSKERLEIYSLERTYVIDNFRRTKTFGDKKFKGLKTRINKGHKAQFQSFLKQLQSGGEPIIPFHEIVNTTKASFAALESLMSNKWIKIDQ